MYDRWLDELSQNFAPRQRHRRRVASYNLEEAVMADAKAKEKRGWIERQKAKRRARAERTGETREKKGERPKRTYDPQDMADQAAQGAIFGGSRRRF
jgi:hypothetical protein